MADLRQWHDRANRKPLVLRGVRQCGKTWLLREFGRQYYQNLVYLNFEQDPSLAGLFETELDPRRIIRDLSILRGQVIDPLETLIVFDEVQQCPAALTSLKYFAEQAPEYAVAAAGSLLGLAVHGSSSFPVGKVDFLDLYPVSFDEFLLASGHQGLGEYLQTLSPGMTISAPLAAQAESLLQEYLIVGGMPKAIDSWLADHDIEQVERIQQAILDSYSLDMAKHAGGDFAKLSAVWRSIPRQLAKENQKFIFSQVLPSARAKDLEGALEWLVAAGIVVKLTKVSRPSIPLTAYADDRYFKLYLADVGLLRRLADVPASVVIHPSGGYELFRGALVENYLLTQLLSSGLRPYFWRSDNTAEIDFLIRAGADVVPIDAKASTNTISRSMGVYRQRYDPPYWLKVSLKPTVNGNLPLYAAGDVVGYLGRWAAG